MIEKRAKKAVVEQSQYDSQQGGRRFDETHTRKVKGKRESEAPSLKYDSPGDDEQSDTGRGSRDQEEHDIQQKRRKKKKERRGSSMSPTGIGSSSPFTSQEEKKKQPVSKKQGHRKKHVRKMKEKSGYGRHGSDGTKHAKRERIAISSSSETDSSSSPECGMLEGLTKDKKRKLKKVFQRSFGTLCCIRFDPVKIAALLQGKGLIAKEIMEEMIISPESQQMKIISLVKALEKKIRRRPDLIFLCIKVLLESDVLHEAGKDILIKSGL